eukprot:4987520-Prymnesium_polylepis.1
MRTVLPLLLFAAVAQAAPTGTSAFNAHTKLSTYSYPSDIMTCPTAPALTTLAMDVTLYEEISANVVALYELHDAACNATYCPRHDFVGCAVRFTGHDCAQRHKNPIQPSAEEARGSSANLQPAPPAPAPAPTMRAQRCSTRHNPSLTRPPTSPLSRLSRSDGLPHLRRRRVGRRERRLIGWRRRLHQLWRPRQRGPGPRPLITINK